MALNGHSSDNKVSVSGTSTSTWKTIYNAAFRYGFVAIVVPFAGVLSFQLARKVTQDDVLQLANYLRQTEISVSLLVAVAIVCLLAVIAYFLLKKPTVYLLDFAVSKPPDSWKVSTQDFTDGTLSGNFTQESIDFQLKLLSRSGLSDTDTYLPPVCQSSVGPRKGFPVRLQPTTEHARAEFESIIYPAVEEALKKTGLKPHQISVVVVNCSLFNPTPSLSAMLVNKFKFKPNIINYNLSGMGCSAGLIAIDLARQLLELTPNTYALVVSTENITQNWYFGNDKSMLVPNCIFRCGGAAMILSNRWADGWRAKYRLCHVERTHTAASDDAYRCVYQTEDADGKLGVALSKDLIRVAGDALKANITNLAPRVLPVSEMLLFASNIVARLVGRRMGRKVAPYVPDFQQAFEHIIIHPGGRAVIDGIVRDLALNEDYALASRATLYRYGNTSSASIWYALAFIEHHRSVRRGDKVWQIGFGSGFKCNSAVWKANRSFTSQHDAWNDVEINSLRQKIREVQPPKTDRR